MDKKIARKKDNLIAYLNMSSNACEVALYKVNGKKIEDIYFQDNDLVMKIDNNTIVFKGAATNIREVKDIKGCIITRGIDIDYEGGIITYHYYLDNEEFMIKCVDSYLEHDIDNSNIKLFYTYSMYFKRIIDISIKDKDIIIEIELIDNNRKKYIFKEAKIDNKNSYIKGYFRNELDDFYLVKDEDIYCFGCSIYEDDSYKKFKICFKDIDVVVTS